MGKQSQNSTSTTSKIYGNTTTNNPYASATTNNSGTTANFQPGTALDSIYNFVNKNMDSLLDEYLNPNLNSTTNQAKLNAYTNKLNSETYKNLENNIINPLSNRNMVRSSQATDLYKNLSDQNASSLSSYINDLLADSQENTASMMNNLLAAYMQGYNVISDMQNQSLQTSAGNGTTTTNSSSNSNGLGMSTDSAGKIVSILEKVLSMYSGTSM
ncbi:TPA: hypothetical protein CPT92_03935 [Candidatus Gastranaerophilales bacterium HUM_13]|jgi:hypothetical protein|nr:hypothetical protein [Acinetobacter sp.]CCZ49894.1 unknown [Acinetobacter sp. CAG:196]DAA99420.1 MAG TPA: hypothetical protein CPT96_08730 [Candidatus Gastranaerophilales bacterium HUM_10]DAB08499.1 MAG TPA: hypothetical protein CPT92_03935 [Candidatus Gastranaerophilales bacterium HUM_13]DAB11484.1 MAG TPA: hypothetical protein CPT91_06655 [Candidatus Gastranaerophilales bacterium HUM_16]DAB16977.1 MAG TPA: hypothetical protein CPT98_06925 [Candidatus Gastranaerophilales bacterium HUM_19]